MALLNQEWLKSLVAIGREDKKNFICGATGFLVGFITNNSKEPSKRRYYIFLVTNRHVFEGERHVDLRFNTKDGKTKIFKQELFFPNNEPRWLAHRNKKVDLALLNVSPVILNENAIEYVFISEENFAHLRNFAKIGINVGDAVFILGFPLGLSGNIQNHSCAKWGIVSRFDKEIIKDSKAFLIDSSVFPGNSGGPVILRPTPNFLNGTTAVQTALLVGVISGYIPYTERLLSEQTKKVVSLSIENSGLSSVVPMDFVKQIFNNWLSQKKKIEKAQKMQSE